MPPSPASRAEVSKRCCATSARARARRARAARAARFPTGLAEVDRALGGGFPRGRVSEMAGPSCCGRTSLALALLARVTAQGEVAAVVDAADAFDAASAARRASTSRALLWVRPPGLGEALRSAEHVLPAGGFPLVLLDLAFEPSAALRIPASAWPRLRKATAAAAAALVLLARQRLAGTFADLALELDAAAPRFESGPDWLAGLDGRVRLVRSRSGPALHGVAVRWRTGARARGVMRCAPPSAERARPRAPRIACLLVPALPLAAELRAHPELPGGRSRSPPGRGRAPRSWPSRPRPRGPASARSRASCTAARSVRRARGARALARARGAARDALLDAALSDLAARGARAAGSGPTARRPPSSSMPRRRSAVPLRGGLRRRARRARTPARAPGLVAVASSRSVAQIAARQLASASCARPARARDRARSAGDVRDRSGRRAPPSWRRFRSSCSSPDDAQAEALSRFGLRRVGDLLRLPSARSWRGSARASARCSRSRAGRTARRRRPRRLRTASRRPPISRRRSSGSSRSSSCCAACSTGSPSASPAAGSPSASSSSICASRAAASTRAASASPRPRSTCASCCGSRCSRSRPRHPLPRSRASPSPPAAAPSRGDQLDFFRPAGPTPAALARTLAELGRAGRPLARRRARRRRRPSSRRLSRGAIPRTRSRARGRSLRPGLRWPCARCARHYRRVCAWRAGGPRGSRARSRTAASSARPDPGAPAAAGGLPKSASPSITTTSPRATAGSCACASTCSTQRWEIDGVYD